MAHLSETAGEFYTPDHTALRSHHCDACGVDITDRVWTLDGDELCDSCCFEDVSHTLSAWLRPTWTPVGWSLHDAERALRALEPLVARIRARVRDERTKVEPISRAEAERDHFLRHTMGDTP